MKSINFNFMEKTIKNILVPLNFSNSSKHAIQLAIAMCKRHDAALHILQVNKENDFPYPTGKNALLIGIRLESRVAELRSLESYAAQIEQTHQIKCFYHIKEGLFSKSVAETADNFYCDLILVQRRSASSWFNLSFNRDVCTIINNSTCPVLSVPDKCHHLEFKSILFPVSVTKPIIVKLSAALPIIKKNSSSVILLGSVSSANDSTEHETLKKLMRAVSHLFSFVTKNIKNEIEEAPRGAKSILKKATAINSDLIVIAGHAETRFTPIFSYNFTRYIINHSTIPVLSVK